MQPLGLASTGAREVATCDPGYYRWNQWFFLKMLERASPTRRRRSSTGTRSTRPCWPTSRWSTAAAGAAARRREARDPGLLPGDHAVRRRTAGRRQRQHAPRLPGRLARARAADAGALDRQERGVRFRLPARHRRGDGAAARAAAWVFTTRRHHHGRHLLRRRARAPAGRTPRQTNRRSPPSSIEDASKGGTTEAELALKERKACRPAFRHPPAHRRAGAGVGGQLRADELRRRRRDGVPAHDERDFAFAKKYGIDIRQVVRRRRALRLRHRTGRTGTPTRKRGVTINSGNYSGLHLQAAVDAIARRWPPRAWARRRPPGACATGASAASATGARRSPSSTATPAAACRCPRRTCRWCCPRTWCPTAAATRSNKCAERS